MPVTVLLVDALNLIRRVDAAHREGFDQRMGGSTVDSCARSLERALHECSPTHALCVFEGQGKGFRALAYEGYKAGRQAMPEDLAGMLPRIKDTFLEAGLRSVEVACTEADDVIATLATKVEAKKGSVVILSTDKIFLQLLSPLVRVRDHFNKRFLDEAYVMEKFHIRPYQLTDLLALAGDPTNSIPGILGVGLKTAARLLTEFETLENILTHAPAMGTRLGQAIRKGEQDALLFQKILRLKKDIELGENLQSFRCRP